MDPALNNKKGFTLMEMLIVVAIIAILVAVAIPVYNAQIHKAKVAADWANVRAYYAEVEADYLLSGSYNNNVPDYHASATLGQTNQQRDFETITFLNGSQIKLQAGYYIIIHTSNNSGYQILYSCNKRDPGCDLILK